jgi:glycosyltransferase involved in cell wall biosynthesis
MSSCEWPRVALDGVFFQIGQSGIARLWRSVLEEWAGSDFSQYLTVIDRDGTAPRVDGPRYIPACRYDNRNASGDAELLQQICAQCGADLFVSTYYTTPLECPSLFMAYDMIPERLGVDLSAPEWRGKRLAIAHARAYAAISRSTADDLARFYPFVDAERVSVAYPAVSPSFAPAASTEVHRWRQELCLTKPYFLLSGDRTGLLGYKNTALFFRAFAEMSGRDQFAVVCSGGWKEIEPELRPLIRGADVRVLRLDDAGLRAAYTGALALVYPSRCEGFGLPVLEAMACGCPVITCDNTSLREVAGDAALYVGESDVAEMAAALERVQLDTVRQPLIARGLQRPSLFSWRRMADTLAEAMRAAATAKTCDSKSPPCAERLALARLQYASQKQADQLQFRIDQFASIHAELHEARATIASMRSSKFWKARDAWCEFKAAARRITGGNPATNSEQPRKAG